MANVKLSFNLPFVAEFDDYHGFPDLAETLTKLTGRKVSFQEVAPGDGYTADVVVSRGPYYAVFWAGRKDRHILDLIHSADTPEEF